jgi:hypothetical protein
MTTNRFYQLYPHCFLVKGKKLSVVYNTQRNSITYITHDVVELIELFNEYSEAELIEIYSQSKTNYIETIGFLKKENLIYSRESKDVFPEIEPIYESPEIISHCVIEFSNQYNYQKIIVLINKLLIKYLEIRVLGEISDDFLDFLSSLDRTTLRSIQLIINISENIKIQKYIKEKEAHKIISIIYYQSSSNKIVCKYNRNIIYTSDSMDVIKNKNNDYLKNIVLSLQYFLEAKTKNPYYNKRLCINKEGDIMNCLKNNEKFGNINHDNVEEIVRSEQFQKLWNVTHDAIIDVRDNPLRYNMLITNTLEMIEPDVYKIRH